MRCIVAFIDGLAAETMVATCSVSSGAGQHRSLRCVVADVAATNKNLAMDWDLPAALYCDVDELRRRAAWPACVARFTVAGDNPSAFDVEAPEYASAPHALRLDWALDGCAGDYNNYRATQLKNTRDRAISIITSDVYGAAEAILAKSAARVDG